MNDSAFSRRAMLRHVGGGFGLLGLTGALQSGGHALGSDAPATNGAVAHSLAPHFAPRAKRVIFLFMSGGPSQVDTFDPKPLLKKLAGQRPEAADIRTASKTAGLLPSDVKFIPSGQSGIPVLA